MAPADDRGFTAEEDGALARSLAKQAGELLLGLRAEVGHRDPDVLRAAGDRRAHDLIVAELARCRPGDAVLSEEGSQSRQAYRAGEGAPPPARLSAERVWIVDPLDGTREFGEAGRTDWAVHVALWVAGCDAPSRLAAGAVALPAQGQVFATDVPPRCPVVPARRPVLVTSQSRPAPFLPQLISDLGADQLPIGSAGAKVGAVITGVADAYVHAGGQYEWDSAAPVAVAIATGLHASRIDGSELKYNQADPLLPDLVVCRQELAPRILQALRPFLASAAA